MKYFYALKIFIIIFFMSIFHITHGPKQWVWTAFSLQSMDTYLLFDLTTRMVGVDFEASQPGEGEGGRVLQLLLTPLLFSPSATFPDPIQHPISPHPTPPAPWL